MKRTGPNGPCDRSGSRGLNRRAFLRASGGALAGDATLAGALGAAGAAEPYGPSEACQGASSYSRGAISSTMAQTSAGRIRGLYNGRAHVFKGVPYGAPTSGERRFMRAQPPTTWTGVRDATQLGPQSPQLTPDIMAEELVSSDNSAYSEDCLRLNVWTAGVRDGGKRPVMVWFHGGGYDVGSGGDVRYDGTNLAAKQEVVLVTVNERLNAFGFLYLAELGGDKYADSGNAGLLDLVAALQWVHENIAEFGGDPGNVTIFGQSGGGGKTTTLMATPAARGLFHRAIAESGLAIDAIPAQRATQTARELMARLQLKPNQVDELQRMPAERILEGMMAMRYAAGSGGFLRFGPVLDQRTLFNNPWDPVAPDVSRNVPMILGSNLTEACFFPATPKDPIGDWELHQRVRHLGFGLELSMPQSDELIQLYRTGHPDVPNVRLYQAMASDNWLTANVAMIAERKASLRAAPAYVYHFEWITPVEGGRLGAPHTIEIPFVYDNMDVPTVDIVTGSGQERYALAGRMSRAWTTFARTGNPNVQGLPHWPAYSVDQRAVMVFNNECHLEVNPHVAEREAIANFHVQMRAKRAKRA